MINSSPILLDTEVVGNGLIGQTFSKDLGILKEGFVIYASGVSNSNETQSEEFSREKNLINHWLKRLDGRTFIYFSSCSIYGKNNNYVEHKLEVEELIRCFQGFSHIYRLTQVVGVTNNKTLVSFLTQQAVNQASVDILNGATRNLLSILDVLRCVKLVSPGKKEESFTMNLGSLHSTYVINIYERIIKLCNKPFNARLVNGGEKQIVPIDKLNKFLSKDDILFTDDYWKNVLDIWVPRLQQAQEKSNL